MTSSPNGPRGAGHDSFFGGVLRALQKRMRREQFETWFHGFRLRELTDDAVEFTVPSVFVRDWLLKIYKDDIDTAVRSAGAAIAGASAGPGAATGRTWRLSLDDQRAEPASRRSEYNAAAPGGDSADASGAGAAARTAEGGDASSPASDRPASTTGAPHGANGSSVAGNPGGSGSGSGSGSNGVAYGDHGGRSASSSRRDPYLTRLNKDYVFDQYVVGSCNRLAHAAATAIGENPGRAYNPLFIHGNVGLGKTHLLQATCHAILQKQRHLRVLYLSCEDFTNRFIQSIQNNKLDEFRQLHRNVDMLVLDDVQFLAGKDKTQDEFFHTFNALYNANRQIVISSDRSPSDIPTIEERLVSRFKWGLVCEMEKPDFGTRVAIVKRKARVRGVEFGDDVAHFIAERIDSNIRELEGAVVKVVGIAALVERDICIDLVKDALQEHARRGVVNRPVGLQEVMALITREFAISAREICGKRRTQAVSLPRQIGMFLSRERTDHSLEEIGRFFGNRDHTTVLYAVNKIKTRSQDDRMFRDLLRSLDEQLGTVSA